MSMPDLPAYPIPLDAQAHVISLPPAYIAHGLIVVNNGTVSLTVTSARGETWTVAPAGRLEAPLPTPAPNYTFTSARVDPAGAQAAATFTQALITVLSDASTATSTLGDLALLPLTDTRAVTSFSQSIPVPPEIVSLTVTFVSGNFAPNSTGDTQIIGDQSGIVYWHLPSNANSQVLYNFNAPFFAGADTSVTLTVFYAATQGNARTVALWGHSYAVGPAQAPSGSLMVSPSPAFSPWPVSGTLAVSGVPAGAPAQLINGTVVGPAAFTTVATLTVAAAGVYRIECVTFSDDAAGAGKRLVLLAGGSNVAMFGVSQGVQSFVAGARSLAAGATVFVQNAAAGGAGSVYFAAIALYAL